MPLFCTLNNVKPSGRLGKNYISYSKNKGVSNPDPNHKELLKVCNSFNVTGSSSIWTCRSLNICCCFLQAGALEKTKTNIRYSKFDTSKSMRYQGHKTTFLIPNGSSPQKSGHIVRNQYTIGSRR